MKKKINFKDVERFVFMFQFDEKGKLLKFGYDNESTDSDSTELLTEISKNGGKELAHELLSFIETYFEVNIFKNVCNQLNMVHGYRDYISLIISQHGCYVYYSNHIKINMDIDIQRNWNSRQSKFSYDYPSFYHHGNYEIKKTTELKNILNQFI